MLATKDNIDFKKVNRNLKKELSELGFEISNQSCMNLLSRALGYKNYNTYLGMNSKIVNNQRESIKDYLKNETNLDLMDKDFVSEYNEVERFIYLEEFGIYDIFIDREVSATGEIYYLLFRLKDNNSKRVLYSPRYESFSFYVFPTIENAYKDDKFRIEDIDKKYLKYFFRDRINHLKRKSYYNDVIHNDLLDLIDAIYNDREILSNIIKNYPVEVLKEKYDSAVSEFFL